MLTPNTQTDSQINSVTLDFWSNINYDLVILFLLILIFISAIFLIFWLLRYQKAKAYSFRFTLLRIAVPVMGDSADSSSIQARSDSLDLAREKIAVMEQFFSTLNGIRPQNFWQRWARFPYFTLEMAVPFNQEGIAFYMAVPSDQANFVEKQIHSFFSFVSVEQVRGYNIFTPKGHVAGAYLKLDKEPYLPFKTYRDLESDPLNNLTNSLTKLDPKKEGASIQIMVRPFASDYKSLASEIAREMKQGKTFDQAKEKISQPAKKMFKDFWHSLGGGSAVNEKNQLDNGKGPHILTSGEEKIIDSIENKAKKNSFAVSIRLVASSPTEERAKAIVSDMANAFIQFESPEGNRFKNIEVKKIKDLIFDYTFRVFGPKRNSLLCTEELSSLFHFGINVQKAAPRILLSKSRQAPCPTNLPLEGLNLGKNIFRDQETVVKISRDDRRRHLYTIGQTGTGKSTFLAGLIKQDIEAGEGVCVIDPHGELVNKILTFIPENRVQDVILFDPGDTERPMGLNLLEYNRPEQKTFVINEMIDIFDKLYDMRQVGGPMFEQYMRNAMLLVMAHPESGSTLLEISRVLSDPEFRQMKLKNCADPIVVNFWTKEAEKAGGEAALANMVPYITSKLTSFIANDVMRPIIAQQHSSFNLREIMDGQKIVLMNLSKGTIGELNAYLLGMVMVGKILIAAMGRVDMPEEERKDFYLYIDEFHNFTTNSIVSILSEARKYRLNLVIAHQFLKQLDEKIRDAVFGNVGSMASFRVGPEDAEMVAKQYEPVFNSYDLMNLDNFNAYLKIIVSGQATLPFSLKSLPLDTGSSTAAMAVREFSRQTYGRPRAEVEQEILVRIQSGSGNATSSAPAESDMSIK